MSTKHTPGLWSVNGKGKGKGTSVTRGTSGPILARCGIMDVEMSSIDMLNQDYANARLIAAAPDMLAELEGILAELNEEMAIRHHETGKVPVIWSESATRISGITAKATKG